jgi:uncharacterized protein YjbJ (UPF0337 family)
MTNTLNQVDEGALGRVAVAEAGGSIAEFRTLNRFIGGNKMKPSTENQIAGKVHEVKGTIEEKAGQLTNDPDLEGEGIGEKIAGKIQKKIGQVEKVLEKP